jgi:thymidylate synthase (FAD)
MKVQIGNAGFVECIDTFGDDLTVVNAARVSFAKEKTTFEAGDAKLISYLAKNNHNSPFFHPQIRMRIKMPIFVAREWYRHTVGFSRNEVSRRYVDSDPECWVPTELRARDANKKQGSKEECVAGNDELVGEIAKFTQDSMTFYKMLLEKQVAPEVARLVLPQSMYTEFIETASLAAYARLCGLRLDPHAQKEIRDFAEAVSVMLKEKFPVSWDALMNLPHQSQGSS